MKKELNFFENWNDEQEESDSCENTSPQIDLQLRQLIKRVIESLLFSSAEPLPLPKIREITDEIAPLPPRHLKEILTELQNEYIATRRAFRLERIAQGFQLRTHEEYAPYIEKLNRQKRGEKLSYAATEVLTIIAYKQPITRPQIDAIRGVDSSGTVAQLLERDLIEPVGKLEVPGRPTLFSVTKEFLKHFGLSDIKDLTHA